MAELITNYTRRMWENSPSIATPINETNLNAMDAGIDNLQTDTRTLNTAKAEQADLLQSLKAIDYNETTGVFVFHWWNGTTKTVDLHIEAIPVHFSMSPQGVITMRTADGTEYTADVSELIKTYTFVDSQTIDFTVTTDAEGHKTIVADIVDGSVTANKLQPNFLADVTAQANSASESATIASQRADASAVSAQDSEAWAVGQRGGVDVEEGAPQYENNAKYWNDRAREAGTRDGHTIMDENGQAVAQQPNLQFNGFAVADDSVNGKTTITPIPIRVDGNLRWVGDHEILVGYQTINSLTTDTTYSAVESGRWCKYSDTLAFQVEPKRLSRTLISVIGETNAYIITFGFSSIQTQTAPNANITRGGITVNGTVRYRVPDGTGSYIEKTRAVNGLVLYDVAYVNPSGGYNISLPSMAKGGFCSDGNALVGLGRDLYGNYGYMRAGDSKIVPFMMKGDSPIKFSGVDIPIIPSGFVFNGYPSGGTYDADTTIEAQDGACGCILNTATVTLNLEPAAMYMLFTSTFNIPAGTRHGTLAAVLTVPAIENGTVLRDNMAASSSYGSTTLGTPANTNSFTIKNTAATRATQFTLIRVA